MKNDIWPAKHFAKWDTLYVLENMISEGMVGENEDDERSKVNHVEVKLGCRYLKGQITAHTKKNPSKYRASHL